MIVRKGVEPGNVSVDDFEMMSAASDKIVLPFIGKLWGELQLEAEQIMLSAMEPNLLEDYASPETKAVGYEMIARELSRIPKEKVRTIAEQNIKDIRNSNRRDFRF